MYTDQNAEIHDGLLLRGTRLVVPPSLRCDILRYLHDCHQCITKTRQKAASSVWWPGISRDIEKMVSDCVTCEKYQRERIEPMKGTEFPQRPWSRVGVDFFVHKGHTYLLAIDDISRNVEICLVTKKVDTSETTVKLKKVFSRNGIPDILFSDNGRNSIHKNSETLRSIVGARDLIATICTIERRGRKRSSDDESHLEQVRRRIFRSSDPQEYTVTQ